MGHFPGKIIVTASDPETGETGTAELEDNYLLITTGKYYLANMASYANGTRVLTIKRDKS